MHHVYFCIFCWNKPTENTKIQYNNILVWNGPKKPVKFPRLDREWRGNLTDFLVVVKFPLSLKKKFA